MASEASASRAYVLYGVAGCGKTTLGRALVERLNDAAPETERDAVFVDADDLHSPEAREKMSRGEPLTEMDREPWLARVRARMLESARPKELDGKLTHRDVVVACSALRRDHRASLVRDVTALTAPWLGSVDFVFLRVEKAKLENRLKARQEKGSKGSGEEVNGHFFPASLLQSQLDTLEPPALDDSRTICHVFDAETRSSPSAAASALAATLDALLSSRAEWDATARAFLDDWYGRLERLTGGLANLVRLESNVQIDHVCFRCASEASYHNALASLERAGHVVAGSSVVGGREITTVRLRPPIEWRGFVVPAVEVPMPKPGRPKPDGWEHAEVALMLGGVEGAEHLIRLRKTYPDAPWDAKGLGKALNAELSCSLPGEPAMAVKFHHRPLLEVVAHEIERGMAKAPPRLASGFASDARLRRKRLGKRARERDEDLDATDATYDDADDDADDDDADDDEIRSRHDPVSNAGTKTNALTLPPDLTVFADPLASFGLEMREPWAGMVTRGEKTTETRGYALPEALLFRPVALLAAPAAPRLPGDTRRAPEAFLPDAAPAGALTTVALVTFGSCVPYASKEAFADDFANHRVGPETAFGAWAGPGPDSKTPMFAWRVTEVLPLPAPAPSPAATRVFRSLFRLDADAETPLGAPDDASDGSDDDKGRWDDDGENDRPWH